MKIYGSLDEVVALDFQLSFGGEVRLNSSSTATTRLEKEVSTSSTLALPEYSPPKPQTSFSSYESTPAFAVENSLLFSASPTLSTYTTTQPSQLTSQNTATPGKTVFLDHGVMIDNRYTSYYQMLQQVNRYTIPSSQNSASSANTSNGSCEHTSPMDGQSWLGKWFNGFTQGLMGPQISSPNPNQTTADPTPSTATDVSFFEAFAQGLMGPQAGPDYNPNLAATAVASLDPSVVTKLVQAAEHASMDLQSGSSSSQSLLTTLLKIIGNDIIGFGLLEPTPIPPYDKFSRRFQIEGIEHPLCRIGFINGMDTTFLEVAG